MRQKALHIVFLLCIALQAWAIDVPCGTMIELRATSPAGWHFDHWSDGNTDSVRRVEVKANIDVIAYFAPNCGEFILQAVALYDRILVLDMRSIQASGLSFEPEQVTWYRVKGTPDTPEWVDDEAVGTGYYFTMEESFKKKGGEYYALVDMSVNPSGQLCSSLRSVLIHFSKPEDEPEGAAKKIIRDRQILILRGEEVYTIDGRKVNH